MNKMQILNIFKRKDKKKSHGIRRKRRITRMHSIKFKLISFAAVVGIIFLFFFIDSFREFKSSHYILNFCNFTVKKIQVIGIKNVTRNKIDQIVASQSTKIISQIDIDKIKEDVEKIEWVDRVYIQRRLPSILRIEVIERHPVAIWQNKKKNYLVDKSGKIIHSTISKDFSSLPIIVGELAPSTAFQIINATLHFPELKKRITGYICIRGRRWNIEMDNSLIVKLPGENNHNALSVLSDMVKHNKISNVLMESIDLRDEDRVIIKFKEKHVNSIKKNKKSKTSV
ncbi:MAG: hypothetical protein C0432_04985 [Candidatus Puniceispirillum sp.]|nr:hypothetical protein [Candidatus Pelagibacter sp.]MBA4283629.1 hypothetical protein [Candidatus Puniceispirillum sp.]